MTPAPTKELISLDYLDKVDIRIGTVLAVEDVPKSGELLRLQSTLVTTRARF